MGSAIRDVAEDGSGPSETLDLRQLPAPEPLVRALACADALAPGAAVTVLTPLLPTPLLDLLPARGVAFEVDSLPGGAARVRMWRPAAAAGDDSNGEAQA